MSALSQPIGSMARWSRAHRSAASSTPAAAAAASAASAATRPRRALCRLAAAPAGQQSSSSGAGLADMSAGWGVEVPADAGRQKQQPARAPAKQQPPAKGGGGSGSGGGKDKRRAKRTSTPFVQLQSPEGRMGLAMLQESLAAAEASGAMDASSIEGVKSSLSGAAPTGKRRKAYAMPASAAAAARGAGAGAGAAQAEDGIDEFDIEDGDGSVPSFQITYSDAGREVFEFDERGRPVAMTAAADEGGVDGEGGAGDGFSWGVDDGLEGWDQIGGGGASASDRAAGGSSGGAGTEDDEDDDPAATEAGDVRMLRDIANDDDWGLDGLEGAAGGARRPSMLAEAMRERREREEGDWSASAGDAIAWGGSGGATGIDLEEQEAVLSRFFRPHEVQRYMRAQREVDENYAAMRARAAGVGTTERRLHRQLKIISGSAAGRRLASARGAQTRPMMEKVRAAIFDMVQSQAGSVGGLPRGCRWLDLFAGTGSVGLEALSRGAGEAHFVELDPWVHRRVLKPNIEACGFSRAATCHASRAEDFLRRAIAAPSFAGGAFDFVSVCPPYLLVSYPELYDLLEASSLLHERSIAFVEYPKQLADHVRPTLGPLVKVRDRKYGRTWIAVYAPPPPPGDDGEGRGGAEGGDGGGDEGGGGAGGGFDDMSSRELVAEWGT